MNSCIPQPTEIEVSNFYHNQQYCNEHILVHKNFFTNYPKSRTESEKCAFATLAEMCPISPQVVCPFILPAMHAANTEFLSLRNDQCWDYHLQISPI